MADIRLARPAAGAAETVACAPEARFVFDFAATDATLARDGDNLTIRFEDGASLTLEGFYTEYTGENLPSFSIDGTEVAAADFFAAMNEPDLMPAAGPAAGTPTGGRFHEYADASLAGGLEHLNGLDWGFSRSFEWEEHPNAVGGRDDDGGRLFASVPGSAVDTPPDNPVDVTPENPGELPPDTPEMEDSGPGLPRDVLTVKEEDLSDTSRPVASGAMEITAPDGVASIVIGGVAVWANGALTAEPVVRTDEGELRVTGFDPATGRLEYSYTLTRATQEHGAEGKDSIAHNLQVTVTDADGDTASSVITVVVEDDVPVVTGGSFTLGSVAETATDASASSVAERFTVDAGADGEQSRTYSLSLGNHENGFDSGLDALVAGEIRDIHLYMEADGSIVARAGEGVDAPEVFTVSIDGRGVVTVKMAEDGTASIRHPEGADSTELSGIQAVLTVTDADNDSASSALDLTLPIDDSRPVVEIVPGETANVCRTSILLDFTGATELGSTRDAFQSQFKDDDPTHWTNPQMGSDHEYSVLDNGIQWITVKGIKLIATRVEYDLDNGHVDNMVDRHSDIGGVTDKNLFLSEDGLGMGRTEGNAGNWGGNEFGSNPQTQGGKGQAEAFVIEPQNGSVWYELDVELSNFSGGERAVIYFYLTPQNNNDDNVVVAREIDPGMIDPVTGSIKVDVPEGFTKAILAAMPTPDGAPSSFSVAKLNLSKNAVEHNGQVVADAADGVAGMAWDWSGLAQQLESGQVVVSDTPGAGIYTIEFIKTSATEVEAVLRGTPNAGGVNLDGNPLFRGHLDSASGMWSIDQFYKFRHDSVDIENLRLPFVVTDGDGDETRAEAALNMELESGLDRFDNVDVGYYNKKLWGDKAEKDQATDIMGGENGNDLMYGRGGNDILSGDGGEEAFRELGDALFKTDWSKNVLNYFVNEDGYDANGNPIVTQGDLTIRGGTSEQIGNRVYSTIRTEETNTWDAVKGPKDFIEKLAALDDRHQDWNGDDALYGGQGDDVLLGWGGSDYLNGGQGKDMLFAGSGNDIIVYDRDDFVVDGGKGIDILLVGRDGLGGDPELRSDNAAGPYSLRQLLLNVEKHGDKLGNGRPHVSNVEMMLRAKHTNNVENLGITSQNALAAYGIIIMGDHIELNSDLWAPLMSKVDAVSGKEEPGCWGSPNDGARLYTFTYNHDGVELELDIVRDKDGFPHIEYKSFPQSEEAGIQTADADAIVVAPDDANDDASASDGSTGTHVQSVALNDHGSGAHAGSAGVAAQAANGEAANGEDGDGGLDAFLTRVESLGGEKADALIFGAGDDIIAGGEGRNFIYAGGGDDLIVYDPSDYLIDGGEGIDFLLAGAGSDASLGELLTNASAENGPLVNDVEVLLKAENTGDLTSLGDLRQYGIGLGEDGKSVTLDGSWKQKGEAQSFGEGENQVSVTTWENDSGMTLETTLQVATDSSEAEQAAQTIVLSSNS